MAQELKPQLCCGLFSYIFYAIDDVCKVVEAERIVLQEIKVRAGYGRILGRLFAI